MSSFRLYGKVRITGNEDGSYQIRVDNSRFNVPNQPSGNNFRDTRDNQRTRNGQLPNAAQGSAAQGSASSSANRPTRAGTNAPHRSAAEKLRRARKTPERTQRLIRTLGQEIAAEGNAGFRRNPNVGIMPTAAVREAQTSTVPFPNKHGNADNGMTFGDGVESKQTEGR